jgi:hypothetical protein
MPETESVTLTINFNQGVFQTKLEKNGYFDINLTKVLTTAIKEAVNFASDETVAESVTEPVKQEAVDEPVKDMPPLVPAWDSPLDDDEVAPVKRCLGRKRSGCRDPKRCFVNGQKIRHRCRATPDRAWWMGVFHNSPLWTGIEGEGMSFSDDDCVSQFARTHYYNQGLNPSSPPPVYSYWDECECLIDGQWVSTYNLPAVN